MTSAGMSTCHSQEKDSDLPFLVLSANIRAAGVSTSVGLKSGGGYFPSPLTGVHQPLSKLPILPNPSLPPRLLQLSGKNERQGNSSQGTWWSGSLNLVRGPVRETVATVTKISVCLSPFSCLTLTHIVKRQAMMTFSVWEGVGRSRTPHRCVLRRDLVSVSIPLLINRKPMNKFASPSLSFPLCSMGFSGNQMGQSEQRAWSGVGWGRQPGWQHGRGILARA